MTIISYAEIFTLALGVLHAMEPGHGKTALLSYCLGRKINGPRAMVMGISGALTHGSVVIILVLILRYMAHQLKEEQWHGRLELASSALLVILGLWMLKKARCSSKKEVSCCENHAHRAEKRETEAALSSHGLWFSAMIGISGGLLPCPTSLATVIIRV